MKKFFQSLLLLLLLCGSTVNASIPPTASVKGQIISLDDEMTVPYATLFIKGSNSHYLSDKEGQFSVQANIGDIIIVSSLGYKSEEIPVTSHQLTIKLAPMIHELQSVEVVATALGIKRAAREIGSSAEVVSSKELNKSAPVNPLTGLTGKVAGLRINTYDSKVDPQLQVRIRGSRSINGDNDPLYVVDGVPVPDINRLNANDIESVTVLKGANAAALYGSEGVNGALIITTKTGEKGKGRLSYKNTTTFSEVYLLPTMQKEFGQGMDGVYNPTQYQSWGPKFDGTMKDFGLPLPDGTQPQILYAAPTDDMRKDLFTTGLNMQNDLSFAKENEHSSFFMSLHNTQVKGIIPDDKSTRTSFRFNGSQLWGNLKATANINYTDSKTDVTPDGPWVSTYQFPANFPIHQMKNWEDANSWGNPNNFFTADVKNPYFLIDTYRNKSEQQLLSGKAELEYRFTPWLKAMYRLGLYNSSTQTRNTVAKFEASGKRNQVGSVADGATDYRRINGDFILSVNRNFGDFNLSAIFGHNLRDDYTKGLSLEASNLLFPDLFNQGSRTGDLTGSSAITRFRQLAAYAEFNAGYKNYLFITLTGRKEWVSVLSKENRSYFYPGVSGSFVFSDAIASLSESEVLSYGKLFASFNKTGNVSSLKPYSLNNAFTQLNNFPYGNLVGFTPSTVNPNANIKPEFVRSFEIGTQLSFFERRLNLDAAYAYSISDGQIFTATSSAATGYTSSILNVGTLTNDVIELSADVDVIRNRDWRWNIGLNYTYIANKVKDLYGTDNSEEYNIFRQSYAIKGKSFPSLKVTDYKRDPEGHIIVNSDGLPTAATDPTYLGTMVPPHQLGMQTTLNYKGLTLNMEFDARLGAWMYSEVANRMIQRGVHPMTTAYDRQEYVIPNSVIEVKDANGHISHEPNTKVAKDSDKSSYWNKYVAGYSINYAAPGDYLKLKTVSIQYTLPRSWMSKQQIVQDVTIGLLATNLFIIKHKDNDFGDPEYLYNNTAGYYSWRQVPPYRTYGFSLNVAF